MATKSKTVKKVTEIPEASVKIEVEQTVDEAEKSETTEELEETAQVETHDEVEEESKEPEKEPSLEPILNSLDEEGESSNSISWKKIFLYTFVAAGIGVIILLACLYIFKNYNVTVEKKAASKELTLPSTAPTPTTAEVDKEAYSIVVLNGSGIAGEAANVQKLLVDAGFKVGEIGNAESQDFTDTEISATKDVDQEYLDELEKALGNRGDVKVVKAPSTQTDDVVVTVGSSTTSSTKEISPTP